MFQGSMAIKTAGNSDLLNPPPCFVPPRLGFPLLVSQIGEGMTGFAGWLLRADRRMSVFRLSRAGVFVVKGLSGGISVCLGGNPCFHRTGARLIRRPALEQQSWVKVVRGNFSLSGCRYSTDKTNDAPEEGGEEKRISVTIVDKDGEEKKIMVPVGMSMLEAAHESDIELEGACEGSLACSTCHVIVMDVEYYNKLEDPTDEENDMLDLAFGLTETSRLGCQVIAAPELDGIRLAIPAATRNFAVDGWSNYSLNLRHPLLPSSSATAPKHIPPDASCWTLSYGRHYTAYKVLISQCSSDTLTDVDSLSNDSADFYGKSR
ncbi:hypothetical protein MLD38_005865 [Melastoma candidum]|uniref:Uncharacterized protein n=1 Tax=Melastoma candidum TaxID=119954 RepID=A0ACB9RKN3_9MYRT|nr:hypothetical protein MLD38_005865 [Melastoma candidum]